ncbi:hypothetical protein [Kurthia huakuii]|uniref:hypothetical protein n=1 Tax=Kurthia huakuii TaxID=1421019 RepID=UPI000496FEB7|nr:hypothetical protein [Kurthia huakuii]MBM7700891.1 hypothetical protein [Kurthia huakuii]
MRKWWSYLIVALIVLTERCFAKQFLRTQYGLELTIPIYVSTQILQKGSLGIFVMKNTYEPSYIAIDASLASIQNRQLFRRVLVHELVHYALFVQQLPFDDDSPLFHKEILKHGSLLSGQVAIENGHFSLLEKSS